MGLRIDFAQEFILIPLHLHSFKSFGDPWRILQRSCRITCTVWIIMRWYLRSFGCSNRGTINYIVSVSVQNFRVGWAVCAFVVKLLTKKPTSLVYLIVSERSIEIITLRHEVLSNVNMTLACVFSQALAGEKQPVKSSWGWLSRVTEYDCRE